MPVPFVSVVVLNYNGLRFLDDCLGALMRQDYPRDRYDVVLVDNASADGSAEVAERRFPSVRILRSGRNLGFAAGNNVALRASRADYVALLNNDTAADPQWLARLVEVAEREPIVGICTSKLLFQHHRARLSLEVSPFRPSDYGSTDRRELGVQLLRAAVVQGDESREAEYLEGFFGQEPSPMGLFRWSAPIATLGLRVRRDAGSASLRLTAAAPRPQNGSARLSIHGDRTPASLWDLDSRPCELEVPLPDAVIEAANPVIQNAGTLILRDGSGRDRGTVVNGTDVHQEDDLGQYDRPEEVFAACGAALLFKRAMLDDVGLFDEDFFMYYEDMDLSWRARRRGWKVLFVPGAVVRHVHCGSSGEWSPLFLYNVERNRLLMLAKNAPLGLAARQHLRYAASAALNVARCARSLALRSADRGSVAQRSRIQLRVLASLAAQLPRTAAKRRALSRREIVPAAKLLEWMAEG